MQAQMTNQASPVEEQVKLLDEALNVVKVQVINNFLLLLLCWYAEREMLSFCGHKQTV